MGADNPMVHAAAVCFGGRLDPAARPFFVAGLSPMDVIAPGLREAVSLELDVGELSPIAERFGEWFEATARNDHRRCTDIRREIDSSDRGAHVYAALAELVRFADVLRKLARQSKEVPN